MHLDELRSGWPEPILTGRYAFRTRRRDRVFGALNVLIEWMSFGWVQPRSLYRLHILVGHRPRMTVVHNTGHVWQHVPPGTKVCAIDSSAALITLIAHTRFDGDDSPQIWDVLDNRSGVFIGRLQKPAKGGRTTISGADGQVAGEMYATSSHVLGPWPWSTQTFEFTVDDQPVAWIRQRRRVWNRHYQVDVSGAAAAGLDPRLVLAGATRVLGHRGTF